MIRTLENVDHIVYAVPNLEEAISDIEKKLGVAPQLGGQHKSLGTHNALVSLGNGCYLELIAADPNNSTFSGDRWMGIDLITKPTITRWAVKTNDLDRDIQYLKDVDPRLGNIKGGTRKKPDGTKFIWKSSTLLPTPKVEILPFIIYWKGKEHPTKSLPDGCKLVELRVTHPTPYFMETAIHAMNIDIKVAVSEEASITAVIETPNGAVELS